MGVIYTARPLDHEIARWLSARGVACPAGKSGRNPSVAEVRQALGEIVDVRYHQSAGPGGAGWQIDVMHRADPANGRWTSIVSSGERDERAAIAFHKGWSDLIIEIAYRLSARTGPLVLIPDTGDPPLAIWPARSLTGTMRAAGVSAPAG
jgi:hypothetical protein